jgi:2-polyprenyl-3-methyl-5-hydroxy-6-metoxy-1,4-benzoquinol methylase
VPTCPQCGYESLKDRGEIARGRFFAGKALVPPWHGGSLYACNDCSLAFRYPRRPQVEYEALYESASAQVWGSANLRADQKRVLALIREHCRSGSILDIGCYDASMLAALGGEYSLFGVEASTAAAEVARSRGVDIIASSIDGIAQSTQKFDVVTATDVIEHVLDPLAFLRTLVNVTSPSGIIILSTGNSEASIWKLLGGSYWYCAIPEHLSFISPKWGAQVATTLGLHLKSSQPYRYDVNGKILMRKMLNFVGKLCLYLPEVLLRQLSSRERLAGPRLSQGCVGLFKDHVLLVFTIKS